MDLFSIACTTCQAKLRVRDAAAIGQIVTCPKCGSMVLIEAPSSPGATQSTPTITVAGAAKPPPRPAAAAVPQPGEATLKINAGVEKPAVLQNPASMESSRSAENIVDDLEASAEAVANQDSTPAVGEVPETQNADAVSLAELAALEPSGGRRWVLAALAGTTGALMAVTLFAVYAIATAKNPTPKLTANAKDSTSKAEPAKGMSESVSLPPSNTPTLPPPIEQPQTQELQSSETQSKPTTIDDATKPTPMPPSPAVEESAAKADVSRSTTPDGVSLPNAPPGFTSPDSDKSKADRLSGTESLSDTLRKLGGLFDDPATDQPATDQRPATEKGAPGTEIEPVETPAKEEPTRLVRPAQRTIDVQARLNDSIPEIEFTNIPLIQFLQFTTDFSTIPVTLDPDVLPWLEITPTTPVSMKQRDTNVAKLLADVLTKIGLTYHVVDQQLFVTRRPTNDDAKTKANWSVADLVGTDTDSINRLRDNILELIAPESWDETRADAGSFKLDGTTIVVEQTEDVLFQIIAFCEKLRVARGLRTRGKYNAKNFELTTRTQRAQSQLAKPVTLNYSRPTTFVKILHRLSDESGMQMLVDWRSASEAGWNPDAEVTFTVVDQPLAKALGILLQPMELDYRIVDETTIQIVTPQELGERYELEFYPVGKIFGNTVSAEDVLKRSLDLVPAEWLRSGGGRGAMRYDAPSQTLLVSLTQRQHQQFAEKLVQLGKKP